MNRNFFRIISVVILLLITIVACREEHVIGVILDQTSLTLAVDHTVTLTATVIPPDAVNKAVNWKSSDPAVATVDNNGTVITKKEGTAIITVVTEDGNFTAKCMVTVPVWVDIYGIRWSKYNVDKPGTFVAHPEDAGMLYQWNRKVGWSSTDPMVSTNGDTVWNVTNPVVSSIWEYENNPCPHGWRVPTNYELATLADAPSVWGYNNGVPGRYFGNGEHQIFLPAAGERDYNTGELYNVGASGKYWSSNTGAYPWYFFFHDNTVTLTENIYYTSAHFVRCVKDYDINY
jgi:uncharacterized protein (TIGR02145 family)